MIRRCLLALLIPTGLALAAAPAGSAPPTDRSAHAVTKVNYPGYGIEITRTSGDQRKLEGTPRSFKKFVKARLDVLFEEAGSKPRCASSPTVVVDRYHSRGFASAGEGWYGECPSGGYSVIYRKSETGWQQILGAQEARFCQDLAWYGVPAFIGGRTCLAEDFKLIRYGGANHDIGSPEATARRSIALAGGNPIVPAAHVISPPPRKQLKALIDGGAYLTAGECLEAADGGPLAVHLGDASYGCVVTATQKNDTVESFMLRMYVEGDDLLAYSLQPFA